MSIALPWSEFKAYVAEVGPGRGGVARPAQCVFCDGERVWFNGWRQILVTLLVDGQPHRLADWLPLQRVRCAQPPCRRSWTLRPPWLYPHRSLEPDLAETAALTYLADAQATYRSVAQRVGCSWGTVWRHRPRRWRASPGSRRTGRCRPCCRGRSPRPPGPARAAAPTPCCAPIRWWSP